jgi:hypothetical protein
MLCSEAIAQVFAQEDGVLSTTQVIQRIYGRYPNRPWPESMIRTLLNELSVNWNPGPHPPLLRPRPFLLSLGGGRYRRWTPELESSGVLAGQVARPVEAREPTEQAPQPAEAGEATEQAPRPLEAKEPAEQAPQPVEAGEATERAPQPREAKGPAEQAPQPVEAREATEVSDELDRAAIEPAFPLQSDLERCLLSDLGRLELNLRLYQENGVFGRNLDTGQAGQINILAIDENGHLVVIEPRVGRADIEVCGQILSLMGWVTENLARGRRVRGIIIASEFSGPLRYAAIAMKGVVLRKFEMRLTFMAVR